MTYLDQSEIARNFAMTNRVAQCAAEQGIPNPDQWTAEHAREWAAAPGWDDAWAYAQASHPPNPEGGNAYDPGTDEAVITDNMILAQVQLMQGVPPDSEPR